MSTDKERSFSDRGFVTETLGEQKDREFEFVSHLQFHLHLTSIETLYSLQQTAKIH